jgi:hypothetical protein
MSNTDNDTPKPAESGPLDLEAIGKFLEFAEEEPHDCQMEDGYNPADLLDAANKLYAEVKRLRGNIGLLIQKWNFHSPYTRDTLKAKDVLAALQDALVSENYYAGEEE